MKILLADDEPTIRLSLVDALEDMGHAVVAAADGQQASDALQREGFDVLVSDIRMPKVDGMTLFRQARQRQPIDVILMTAYAEVSDAVAALKEGAIDYLMKPFDVEELRIRIQRIQERRSLEVQRGRAREGRSQEDPTRKVIG